MRMVSLIITLHFTSNFTHSAVRFHHGYLILFLDSRVSQICELVKIGKSSDDIAEEMETDSGTVRLLEIRYC